MKLFVGIMFLLATVFMSMTAEARRVGEFRCEAEGIPDKFDAFFSIAARRHMPHEFKNEVGACITKAICWIESRHNPDARSGVGAVGLCQIMEATAQDLERRGQWRGRLRNSKDNAEASAIVFANFWRIWSTPRSAECRLELTLASYNAGPKNIIDAQRVTGGALCWEQIQFGLPEITGDHSKETIQYLIRWWEAWRRLRGYGL